MYGNDITPTNIPPEQTPQTQENERLLQEITTLEITPDSTRRRLHQEQEDVFEHLFAFSPIVLFRCKATGDFGAIFISENVSRIFGYAPQAFTEDSQFWANHIHPEDAPRVFAELGQIFEHGQHSHEYRFRMPDGSYRWIHDHLQLIRDELGNPIEMVGSWEDITKRKQAEEDLRQSRILFEQFLNNIPAACYVLDEAGRYLMVNDLGIQAMGVPREAVVGHLVSHVLPAEVAANWEDYSQQVLASHIPVTREQHIALPDGVHTYLSTFFPIEDAPGKRTMLGGISLDITARKRSEEALRIANQQIEQFLEGTPLATIEFNHTGTITRWNKSAEQIFGWTAAEALGQEVLLMVTPPIGTNPTGDIGAALRAGQIFNGRNDHLTGDGRTITCHWYTSVRRDDAGNVLSVLAQAEDVTEQVRREAELRMFKTLADNAPDGIAANTLDGTLIYANASYQTMHGYGPEIIGMSHQCVLPNPEELNPALHHLDEHGFWQGTITHQRRDGSTFPVMASVFTIFNEAGQPVCLAAIDRDITAQQRTEQERAALQQQVIDAQRDTVRELSTPLIPISDEVLIMPLIGSIDTQRAQQIMETMLNGVAQHQATLVIIDITGVAVVDTQVAQALVQAAQAVRLLGAKVMLTGIQPTMAQTLVHLNADLQGIVTRGTLQKGIAAALQQVRSGQRTFVGGSLLQR